MYIFISYDHNSPTPSPLQYILQNYTTFVSSDFLAERSQSEAPRALRLEVDPGVAGGRHPLEGVLRLHPRPVLLPLLSPVLHPKL